MKMRLLVLGLSATLGISLAGCHGFKASTDNATLKTGLHMDTQGRMTDDPEVTVPMWSSKGLKEKPTEVTPTKE
jgi:hypothetical protein